MLDNERIDLDLWSNMLRTSKWIIVALCSGMLYAAGANNDDFVEVEIYFKPIDKALYYEVQWLKSQNPLRGMSDRRADVFEDYRDINDQDIEKILANPIHRKVPESIKYFRIRSVSRENRLPGPWGQVFEVETFKYTPPVEEKPEEPVVKNEVNNIQLPFVTLNFDNGEERKYLTREDMQFTAVDSIAGIKHLYYNINRRGYQVYEGPIAFPDDDHYLLNFYSEDHLGNREDPQLLDFWVDRTAPKTEIVFEGKTLQKNGYRWLSKDSTIRFNAIDNSSGIEKTMYRLSSLQKTVGDFSEAADRLRLTTLGKNAESQFIIEYYSIDRMQNKEEVKQSVFVVDDEAPRVTLRARTFDKLLHDKVGKSFDEKYHLTVAFDIVELSLPVKARVFFNGEQQDEIEVQKNLTYTYKPFLQGSYTVKVLFTDALGNESSWSENISSEDVY